MQISSEGLVKEGHYIKFANLLTHKNSSHYITGMTKKGEDEWKLIYLPKLKMAQLVLSWPP